MFARLRFQVNIIIYPDSYVSLPESRLTANLHGYVENNQDQRRREERARRRLEEGNLTWVEDADSSSSWWFPRYIYHYPLVNQHTYRKSPF